MQKIRQKFAPYVSLMLLASSPAFATYACQGPVQELSINTSGNIIVSAGGITLGYLCSVTTTTDSVDPETCKAVYATLLAAEASGQSVELWFNDSLTCTTHTEYTFLTGWYSGPALAP